MLVSGKLFFPQFLSPTLPPFAVPWTQSKRMHTPRLVATPRPLLLLQAFPHDLVHDPWGAGTTRGAYPICVWESSTKGGMLRGEIFTKGKLKGLLGCEILWLASFYWTCFLPNRFQRESCEIYRNLLVSQNMFHSTHTHTNTHTNKHLPKCFQTEWRERVQLHPSVVGVDEVDVVLARLSCQRNKENHVSNEVSQYPCESISNRCFSFMISLNIKC